MTAQVLTPKQLQVYIFIRDYLSRHQRAPYIREIQDACNIASYKSAVDRLLALERKGWINRAPNKHRGISLREEHWPIQLPEPVPVPSAEPSLDTCKEPEEPMSEAAGVSGGAP